MSTNSEGLFTTDWFEYLNLTKDLEPREMVARAMKLFKGQELKPTDCAIDLGAGGGRDTAALATLPWRVVAVDADQRVCGFLKERFSSNPQVSVIQSKFEEFDFPSCDLINAACALPFVGPEFFDEAWNRVVNALKPTGIFVGNFFWGRSRLENKLRH